MKTFRRMLKRPCPLELYKTLPLQHLTVFVCGQVRLDDKEAMIIDSHIHLIWIRNG